MTKPTIQICALVTLVQVLGLVPALRAQTQEKASTAAAETAPTAKVDVVLMRYQGDKKVSSLPFTLYAASNSATKLRMGLDVPLPQGGSSYQYRSIGTSIDCQVSPATAEGRYPVLITVNDSSVYAQQNEAAADLAGRPMTVPILRPLKSHSDARWPNHPVCDGDRQGLRRSPEDGSHAHDRQVRRGPKPSAPSLKPRAGECRRRARRARRGS